MAALGLLLGMIGIDPMSGYFRFAYGVVELGDGIGVVPVAVGLFGARRDPAHGRAGDAAARSSSRGCASCCRRAQEWRESARRSGAAPCSAS